MKLGEAIAPRVVFGETLVELVSGRSKKVLATVEDAIWAQKALEAAEESERGGRTITISAE